MSVAMKGLKLKPNYEDLINAVVSDKVYNVKFPNRDASFLRNGFVTSQLDGEGARIMEKQQELASKESYKEHVLKEIAKNTANTHDLRNNSHQELRTERVNQALSPTTRFYNMSRSDHNMEPAYSLPPSDEIEIRDHMSTRAIPRSETTYLPSLSRSQAMSDDVANQSSAVADLTNEVERQMQTAENERRQQEIRQTRQ